MPVPVVYMENRGAATLTQYLDFYRRTKHIYRERHFARECVEAGNVIVKWVAGEMNPADILTKPVIGTGGKCNPLQWRNGSTSRSPGEQRWSGGHDTLQGHWDWNPPTGSLR